MSRVTAISNSVLTFDAGNFLCRFFDIVGQGDYNAISTRGGWGIGCQSWAIGTWDRYSGIPVLPEVKNFYRLPKY